MIGKVAGAALLASGLVGTGYVAAPKEPAAKPCDSTPIIIRPKIIIEGREVKPK